ncbi:MAG: ankyrin repeat domain-containing protein, partial [Bacilli bacterium]
MIQRRGDKKKFKEFVRAIKKNPLRYYFIHTGLKKLAEDGVDLNTQTYMNQTLLHLAIKLENARLLRMFLKAGVNVNLANEGGLTPLHMAVLEDRLDFVRILVLGGCDCNLGAEMEQTPLHLAVCNGKHDISKYLLDHGADIWALDEVNN